MVVGLTIGGIIAIALIILLIYLFGYQVAYHLYIGTTILFLIFTFSLGKHTANYLYGIDSNKTYSIEEQYQNDEKTNTFYKLLGGICLTSILSLFTMSSINLFLLKKIEKTSNWVNISVFVPTMLLLLFFLFFIIVYSHRII